MSDNPLKPRSGAITDGPSRAPARAMLKAVGFSDADLKKPIIGVANTWIEIGPCNYHLRTLAEHVKAGIRAAGGTPMEFNTVSISDGITMGSQGMKTSLISRDLIADSIELVARGNLFDGLIALVGLRQDDSRHHHGARAPRHSGRDALRRIDRAGRISRPQRHDSGRVRGGGRAFVRKDVGRRPADDGKPGVPRRRRLRRAVHREHHVDGGRVPRHFGDGLQRRAGARSREAARGPRSRRAGARAVEEGNLRPRQIITRDSIENAIASVAATGGSTNAVLHLLAIAREAGVELNIDDFDRISAKVPLLADLKPSGRFVATDMYKAGGAALIANRLKEAGLLHEHAMTVTGRTIGEEADRLSEPKDQEVVRPLSNPMSPNGGLAIVRGNLAPEGAVVKIAGKKVLTFKGPARVFDSEEAAFDAVEHGRIKAGDVVIIRYEGPKGGPGMREMLGVTGALVGAGLGRVGGAADRRAILGRDPWPDGRPRGAGSRRRRPHRRGEPTATSSCSTCRIDSCGSS